MEFLGRERKKEKKGDIGTKNLSSFSTTIKFNTRKRRTDDRLTEKEEVFCSKSSNPLRQF
jgi:hypothetical protein